MTSIKSQSFAITALGTLLFVVLAAGCTPPPCSLPGGLVLPFETQQIDLPGLDAQLRRCVASVYDRVPYEPNGHETWDRYMAGDNSALSNEAKVGALLFFAPAIEGGQVSREGRPEVRPGTDFEEIYREHVSRRGGTPWGSPAESIRVEGSTSP